MAEERIFRVRVNSQWVTTPFEDIKKDDIFTHCETEKIYKATSAAVGGYIDADEVRQCRK